MPRYTPKPVLYPSEKSEYHITTPSGIVSCIFEDKDLALKRFAKCPPDWKLLEVTLSKTDVTPEDHDRTAPLQLCMSQAVILAA